MSFKIVNEFHFADWNSLKERAGDLPADERYKKIVQWAGEARGQNPAVFDKLTEWILDDSEWTDDKLAENEQILMQGVFARFKEQNEKLRAVLKELAPSGVVNDAVFNALSARFTVLSVTQICSAISKAVALGSAFSASNTFCWVVGIFTGTFTGSFTGTFARF